MAQRVTAVFPSRDAAEGAADALVDLGGDRSHISILSRGSEADRPTAVAAEPQEGVVEPAREVGDAGAPLTTTDAGDIAGGAAIGAVIGLAAGLLSLIVPGIGLVLAAGPLAAAVAGGAIAGGVFGALRDLGIPEHHARHYEERIRGGGVLMTALVPEMEQVRVRDILTEHGAEDITFAEAAGRAPAAVGPSALDSEAMAVPRPAAAAPAMGAAGLRDVPSGEIRVPVTDETVEVRKEQRQVGEVAVRKEAEVETQHISEPVTQTRVVAERREVPAGAAYTADPNAAVLREGETLRVPVVTEELKVEKVPRVTEEVIIRTRPETEQVERDVQLRHERVEVEEEGDVEGDTAAATSPAAAPRPADRPQP
jgi:uncharacterized protein (TIGR02271 family)